LFEPIEVVVFIAFIVHML